MAYTITGLGLADYGLTIAQLDAQIAIAQRQIIDAESEAAWASRMRERFLISEIARLQKRIHELNYANRPGFAAAYEAAVLANSGGDFLTRVGNAAVSAVPVALHVAAAVAGADLLMGGTLIAPQAATAATAAPSTAAQIGSTASNAQTFSQAVTAAQADTAVMFSAAPVTDASLLAAVSPTAAGTLADVAATQAAIFAPIASDAAVMGLGVTDTFSIMQAVIDKGANMATGTIFDGIQGTVQSVADTVVGAYSTIQGVQLQKAQIDLANAQTKATLQPAPQFITPAGGVNWGVVGIAAAAILGVVLALRA